MELNYENINRMLDDGQIDSGYTDDGTLVTFIRDSDDCVIALFPSKETNTHIWYVWRYFHKDGTVEETYERMVKEGEDGVQS